ncbi:conserved hypothetical protein [Leishmania major strain Friedlin]|uniref:Uncharacterized protein n=1 Tax=Leishmania major TaxID=5664 RepID=E9ADF6_LEIMA|nr:conserved hypothetical protein [Leishmania major strain Friedlin]CAG9576786.1 hypothetical_protein_-_conserved [Leishmania major strain Friedlin]CBZ12246.1 conserved hypothetical protein [Leishmania major strain Friedlin]|eukprot:XP_003721985.1 conserved hypothetical protein [Leishmania major strain Friedlin]
MCEAWCKDGPGSTWPEAPALFFARVADKPPASLLTLCSTCVIAVGGDIHATSQRVLERCHHTPVIRYRTAAYVNAVREYKQLLELMARKVVRSCERMQSIQSSVERQRQGQQRLHAYGAAEEPWRHLNPSVDAARVPLTFLTPSLQEKVLSQLLEALEGLLQRDARAVRLAAAETSLSQESSPLPFSQVMAPRERHVLLEELAHVERQLMSARSSATSAATMPAKPGVSPRSLRERHLYDVPSTSPANTRGRADADDGRVVYSPRSPAQPHRSPPRSSVSPSGSAAEEAAGRLAAVADPRRCLYHHHDRIPGSSHAASVRGHHDASSQAPHPSRSRECSPPELTSPQRSTRGKYNGRVSNAAGRKDGENTVSGSRTRASGGIAVLGIRPPAETTATVSLPFSSPPRRARSTSGNHYCEVDSASRADDEGGAQDIRLSSPDGTNRCAAAPVVQSRPPLDQDGRRSMWAVIDTAIWEAYRRPPPMEGESQESTTHSSGEARAEDDNGRHRRHGAAAAGTRNPHRDSDLQLWDYFAGQLSTTPQLHAGGGGDSGRRTPPSTSPSPDSHPLACEARGSVPPRRQTDATSQTRVEAVAAGGFDGQLSDLSSDDTAALQRRVLHEQQLRREAKEAMLASQAQIAALEMTTNDMAEKLLTHRLAVTFRAHLEGMEMLVGRWTRLAQNFCLQKSLLFAEEASAVVRHLLRVRFGVAPLWSPRTQPQQPQSGRHQTSAYIEAPTSHDERGEELWVNREEEEASDSRRDSSFSSKSDEGHRNGAAVVAHHPLRSTGEEKEAHHRHGRHTDHPLTRSSPERQPLQKLPPSITPASPSFSFPTNLQLRPLSLCL